MAATTSLHPDVHALAEAIRDALDLPYASDAAGDRRRSHLLGGRLATVLGSLDHLTGEHPSLGLALETIRAWSAEHPVDYDPA
jgi:hypothetical protein